jgi:YVTN family beta-propeller protein
MRSRGPRAVLVAGLALALVAAGIVASRRTAPRLASGLVTAAPSDGPAYRARLARRFAEWRGARPVLGSLPRPAGYVAYVATSDPPIVSVIDVDSLRVTATVVPPRRSKKGDLGELAATPDGSRVYLTAPLMRRVFVIDTASNTVLPVPGGEGIPVPGKPAGLLVGPDGTRAYVGSAGLVVLDIDPASPGFHRPIALPSGDHIRLGGRTTGRAATADGRRLYVADMLSDTVSVIDTDPRSPALHTVLGVPDGPAIRVGRAPVGVALDPTGARLYVANYLADTVSVVDTRPTSPTFHRVVGTTRMDDGPRAVAVTPDATRVYVLNWDAGRALVVDTESRTVVLPPLHVGLAPIALALTPDGTRALVTNLDSRDVSVIDTDPTSPTFHSVLATIPVAGRPTGVVVLPSRPPRSARPQP